ncbi:hypothetical protein Srot_0535 [Segniliparus rotundus DSM 44985]|uniref:Lipoprotein n=1 Tax=Segniliparus rotundus (strain ATCC BAA-972 / CDC 1076 / CIP 108378 / DSM 44985 / JCM 13578) TaxID=640132 RepID=D6ZCH7_SEGRD|nr:hypothetical protein [Segniliparus rotundus]ADG97019.1 hypothetical protein Srot_0535 [Segniliparus rotundus DSM 44985]
MRRIRPSANDAARRRPFRVAAMMLCAVVLTAGAGGCSADRSAEARAIGNAVRALPGVAAADVAYRSGASFRLDVTLAETASQTQAAAVGSTFVDRMRAGDFGGFDVILNVAYPANSSRATKTSDSHASFQYHFRSAPENAASNPNPSSAEVASSLALWLQTAQSPATVGATVHQEALPGTNSRRSIVVSISSSVDDEAIAELIDAHPELRDATWKSSVPPGAARREFRVYRIHGQFPDRERRELWQQILERLGPDDDGDAVTDPAGAQASGALTNVKIDLWAKPNTNERVEGITRAVVPLLPGLGSPVRVNIFSYTESVELILGGCSQPSPNHRPSALEAELRRQYERC